MSRTIPSYRIATEMERSKWKIFRQRFGKEDRKEFDKCFPIHDCTIQRVARLAELGGITSSQDLN
jgi:hypothetical protein